MEKKNLKKQYFINISRLALKNISFIFLLGYISSNAQTYDPLSVQRINELIDNNGLIASKNAPETWVFARWNDENPKQLTMLFLHSKNLTGTASFEGLSYLEGLGLHDNQLYELNLNNCVSLKDLNCGHNNLVKLELTECTMIQRIDCYNNKLSDIDLSDLILLSTFNSSGQIVDISFIENMLGEYKFEIKLNNPTFSNTAISYSEGFLISTNINVETSSFSVNTNNQDFTLDGTMYFTYPNVNVSNNNLTNSLHSFFKNDKFYVSELQVGEPWYIYTISGVLVYQNIASQVNEFVTLNAAKGFYIVQSGNSFVKVIVK